MTRHLRRYQRRSDESCRIGRVVDNVNLRRSPAAPHAMRTPYRHARTLAPRSALRRHSNLGAVASFTCDGARDTRPPETREPRVEQAEPGPVRTRNHNRGTLTAAPQPGRRGEYRVGTFAWNCCWVNSSTVPRSTWFHARVAAPVDHAGVPPHGPELTQNGCNLSITQTPGESTLRRLRQRCRQSCSGTAELVNLLLSSSSPGAE